MTEQTFKKYKALKRNAYAYVVIDENYGLDTISDVDEMLGTYHDDSDINYDYGTRYTLRDEIQSTLKELSNKKLELYCHTDLAKRHGLKTGTKRPKGELVHIDKNKNLSYIKNSLNLMLEGNLASPYPILEYSWGLPKHALELNIMEVCDVWKCSICEYLLWREPTPHANRTHLKTINCQSAAEAKVYTARGYVSADRYFSSKRDFDFIKMNGFKMLSNGKIWVPETVMLAYEQYEKLRSERSPILKAARTGGVKHFGQWLDIVAGASLSTNPKCLIEGCDNEVDPGFGVILDNVKRTACGQHASMVGEYIRSIPNTDGNNVPVQEERGA